jgi:hypothetical protein
VLLPAIGACQGVRSSKPVTILAEPTFTLAMSVTLHVSLTAGPPAQNISCGGQCYEPTVGFCCIMASDVAPCPAGDFCVPDYDTAIETGPDGPQAVYNACCAPP